MADRAMNRIFQFAAAGLLFGLAACNTPAPQPPLQGARIGGAFTLTDQNGKQVTDKDFAGKWRIIYFGYTYCPDICPNDMLMLGKAMQQIDESDPKLGEKIAPIFVSVDPERDTTEELKKFVSQFHPRFTGLTGDLKTLTEVAQQYAVYFRKEGEGPNYLVGHTQIAYLMDPEGKPITSLPLEKDATAIAEEVKRWAK